MNLFQSHEEVLKTLIESFNIKKVLETGMGEFSTSLFLDKCEDVVSIETQNVEWFEKIKNKFNSNDKFKCELKLKSKDIYHYLSNVDNFDLIFVDGRLDRWRQINYCFDKSKIIVAHDVEANCYLWERVIIPSCWTWIDVKNKAPWTAVLTDRDEVIDVIINKFICDMYDFSSFPFKKYLIDNKIGLTPGDKKIHNEIF